MDKPFDNFSSTVFGICQKINRPRILSELDLFPCELALLVSTSHWQDESAQLGRFKPYCNLNRPPPIADN